jgi:hypothetical protein
VIRRLLTFIRDPFIVGPNDCPIMHRWAIFGGASPSSKPLLFPGFKRFTLKVHHFLPNRDDRDVHDHPWPFVTIVLAGGYDDLVPCRACGGSGWASPPIVNSPSPEPGEPCDECDGGLVLGDRMHFGSVKFRGPDHAHRTRSGSKGAWTIVVTGNRLSRPWGFFVDGVKWPWDKYIETFGEATQCD